MSKKQKKKQKIEQFRLPERQIKKPQPEAQEDNVPEKAVAVEEVVVAQATVEKTICEEAVVSVEGAVEEAAVNSEKKTEVHAKEPTEAEISEAEQESEPVEQEAPDDEPINPEASKEVVIEEVAEPETTQEAATEETAAVQTVQEPKITEWKQSEAAVADTKKPEEGTTSEKKANVLKPVGIVMLIVVVMVGIVLVATGKHRDKAVVSDNAVTTTPTATAAELTSNPSANPAIGQTDMVTPTSTPAGMSGTAETTTATSVPVPTDTPDSTETDTTAFVPTPTDMPEATLTPTLTPTSTPVVSDTSQGKYDRYSNTHMGWGVGKNKEHEQPTAWGYDIKYNFDEVGAYYVDKNVSEDDKVIYLTINCGYEVGYTPECLDTLKKHDVKASFFVLEDYIHECPDQIRRMKEEGHLVGNHSAMHLDYGNTSPEKVIADMLRNEEQMREHVGYEMDKIFRPPSGYYNEQTLHIAKDLGYKTYFWSMAYVDWDPDNQPTEEYVVDFFQVNHHNGAIPVIHITSSSGVKSLDKLITMLKEEGYRFGLVSEIE